MERLRPSSGDLPALSASAREGKLSPYNGGEAPRPQGEALIEAIRELYPRGDQPVFYGADSRLHQLRSRETLNNIFTLAQEAQIIPLPHRLGISGSGRWRAFYSRDEIVAAIAYRERLRRQKVGLFSEAKSQRRKLKSGDRLTLKEAADRLNLPVYVFCNLIKEGEILQDGASLAESVKRIKDPHGFRRKLIKPEYLEEDAVKEAVERWQNRFVNLENLTYSIFKGHRALFATVSEVVVSAGLHVRTQEIAQLAQVLIDSGVKIAPLSVRSRRVSYWVLLAQEKEKAAKILGNSPYTEKWRRNPVEQIAGPKIGQ